MEPVDAIPYPRERPPAPGRLRLVQRFVNTVDYEHGREMLHGPERLRALLVDLGLLPAGTRVTAADLLAAHELREALRAHALANNGPRSRARPDPAATAVLERFAADGGLVVRFDARGGATLEPPEPGVRGAFAALVGIVYTAVADGTWPRLKACSRDVCGWLFYDRSRNRSARWCQMAVCGNRTKTRAYRARRRG
ncbi:MAG TPA: CGNR zinc finger domain-containing protein [Gaiellaceae bacterium]|nr:CGNR zinc finger domain-containing protein [Gaiellaceae bacterium]